MKRNNESGVALLSALLVLMLVAGLLVGFVAAVSTDQFTNMSQRSQTYATGAAHAGLEKLTGDLGQLFLDNFNPTAAQINALTTPDRMPVVPNATYESPSGESGYRITFRDENGDGSPDMENPNGTQLTAGDYQGLVGLITPYDVEVTARVGNQAEVRMRRTMQTVAIPVFQFGIFSENSQSFFAGPNFNFGGRVHTNQHLFLKQDGTATLTLGKPVTAVGQVVRRTLANGQTTHNGYVRMAKDPGCLPAPATFDDRYCVDITADDGSVVGDEYSQPNPNWLSVVTSTNEWLKRGKRLELPIVSEEGATAFDLIKRPPTGEDPDSNLGKQRFYNMATLRIILSDRASDLTGVPGAVFTASGANQSPIRLAGTLNVSGGVTGNIGDGNHPFAASTGVTANGFRTTDTTPSIDGWILINRQDRNGNWTDVTKEILNLGFSGRRLSDGNLDTPDFDTLCPEYHPNAVIRVQRLHDTMSCAPGNPGSVTYRDFWPNVLYDPREGMLRDDQNARPTAPTNAANRPANVASGQQRLWWGGVMHYVELDVNNLRLWLNGTNGTSNSATCANGAGPTTCPMDVTGFVVYFSDRRTNRNLGSDGNVETPAYTVASGFAAFNNDQETGELGGEDIINPASANSQPNGVMDGEFVDAQGVTRWAEDINQNAATVPLPEKYGERPRFPTGRMRNTGTNELPRWDNADVAGSTARYTLWGRSGVYGQEIDRNTARVNRAFFFRRALKLVNGGRGNLPANGAQGLTVASENPVYIQGNYNACTNVAPDWGNNQLNPPCTGGVGFGTNPGVDHVSAAVIADAVTVLSNAWNDIRSFKSPHEVTGGAANDLSRRQAVPTWYRLGIIGGKGLNFRRPTSNTTADHTDFGTDGGAHNFIRFVENWGGQALNYRGSLISLYTSRQAVGIYKCCDIVYSAPNREYKFDEDFLTPGWLPPRTPMFRDLNTLTFRQILRPTQ